jgi:hypothetical protein
MVLDASPLLCPFTTASNIFTLKKDIAKQHCNNARLNVPDNASLVVLVEHWLVMGFKTDSSHVHARLPKMEATIENIALLAAIGNLVGNLVVNQLMEREAVVAFTANAASAKEPKWTTVMAKNVH